MEQRTQNNLVEVDDFKNDNIIPLEKKKRGNYVKRNLEKKVTVKHFLNTKLHAIPPEYRGDSPEFNVYLQVTFLRKTTYTRSELSGTFSQEKFDALLKFQPFIDCLQREKNFITDYLTKDYDYNNKIFHDLKAPIGPYIINNSGALKEFKEQISNWGKLYENNISTKIQQGLKSELYDFAQKKIIDEIKKNTGRNILNDDDYDYFTNKVNTTYLPIWQGLNKPKSISALELLLYFENLDSEFSKVREKYSTEIWYFNVYYNLFMSQHNEYFTPIHYTANDLSLWNNNGTFEIDFCSFCRNNSINSTAIVDDINELAYSGKLNNNIDEFVSVHGSHVLYDYGKNCFLDKYNNLNKNV